MHAFLSNLAHRQTDRQTDRRTRTCGRKHNPTPLSEVISYLLTKWKLAQRTLRLELSSNENSSCRSIRR